jgi:hypothetical protein
MTNPTHVDLVNPNCPPSPTTALHDLGPSPRPWEALHRLYQAGNLGQKKKCILTEFFKRTNAVVGLNGIKDGDSLAYQVYRPEQTNLIPPHPNPKAWELPRNQLWTATARLSSVSSVSTAMAYSRALSATVWNGEI